MSEISMSICSRERRGHGGKGRVNITQVNSEVRSKDIDLKQAIPSWPFLYCFQNGNGCAIWEDTIVRFVV
jgi:hypothetical protein